MHPCLFPTNWFLFWLYSYTPCQMGMMMYTFILSTQGRGTSEFKVSLVYEASTSEARGTQRNLVLKIKTPKKPPCLRNGVANNGLHLPISRQCPADISTGQPDLEDSSLRLFPGLGEKVEQVRELALTEDPGLIQSGSKLSVTLIPGDPMQFSILHEHQAHKPCRHMCRQNQSKNK